MVPVWSIWADGIKANKIFSMPVEDKLQFVNVADGSPQRGYSAIGTEKTASLYGKMIGREVSDKLTDARVCSLITSLENNS